MHKKPQSVCIHGQYNECNSKNKDNEDVIVAQIAAKYQKTSDDQESDEADTPEL
jgi:hypothetical protein